MKHVLHREQFVPQPRSRVFAFYADAGNLERLTPESLQFHILTPLPIEMRSGALIEYRIRLFGLPFRWKTLIESFEPESRFVDQQLSGPYRSWRHVHEFVEVSGGTLVRDHVEYELPLGPLGDVASGLFVERQLRRIFDFRRAAIERIFHAKPASNGSAHPGTP
jgi:ligand-binding SRPBCC domain-containing protein